ncbi:MAG: S8 family serine peptidase, partial [Candidatus Doudnabacteria bacterium]|nr:S8 family serine peptidase [Candidatus Doudnabacteria bacterium]
MQLKNYLNNYLKIFLYLSAGLGVFFYLTFPGVSGAFMVSEFALEANDPGFTLNPLNVDRQWGLSAAGFPEAWHKTVGSTSTVVAIVDTGVDQSHEDLQDATFLVGYDFLNVKSIEKNTNSDDNGHGTLVAGILGAVTNNVKGIAGTNWHVSILPVKALDAEGKGESSVISKSIVWAVDHGADIINLSLGGTGFDQDAELAKAVSYAFNQGVVIIAAAGNDSAASAKDLDENPVFPVCNDNNQNMVIGVTALDQNLLKPSFANFGKNCIDVAAPGRRILSTINVDPLSQSQTKSGYAYVSGTSLATAFVSGQAALIKSLYPYATAAQVRDRIISTAKKVDNLNLAQCDGRSCVGKIGSGLIDVPASLSQTIPHLDVIEGDVVRALGQTQVYLISSGQRRPISPFVFNERFLDTVIKDVPLDSLERVPVGPYVMPKVGTLVKSLNLPTVYYVSEGLKLPITAQIFKQRGFDFKDVKFVDSLEIDSWVTGKFLTPKEGTLVKRQGSQTLYWTLGNVLHPVNMAFYR